MQIGDVFSAFDGLSGAQVALNQAGIKFGTYYASEIDKYAIQIAQKNYPKTVQLGDIRNIKGKDLGNIHLMVGGSPCQGFSFATNGRLNFDHPQSVLFFEFVRLLKEVKPRYFLLENVRMANKHKKIISDYLGVEPIEINSSLLSAQSRKRLYWTNIPGVKQPEDLGVILADILENDATEPMYSNIYGGFKEKEPREHYNKSVTIRTASGGGHIPSVTKKIHRRIEKQTVKVRKHKLDKQFVLLLRDCRSMAKLSKGITTRDIAKHCGVPLTQAEHWFRKDSSFSIPPSEIWNKLKEILNAEIMLKEYDKFITEFEEKEGVFEMAERITLPDGKHPTLTASTSGSKIDTKYWMTEKQKEFLCDETRLKKKYTAIDGNKALTMTGAYARWQGTHIQTDKKPFNKSDVRKLTPKEAERLQTLPDNYTEGVSDTQRYKMIGNGFTSLVIAHILSYMKDNPKPLKFQRQIKLL
tara:strand:- start:1134 stop:2540 length:1407 start_codon:yes stop_codon:yes gene_type:complete